MKKYQEYVRTLYLMQGRRIGGITGGLSNVRRKPQMAESMTFIMKQTT
jgi:hypothetical protein